jgi:hypothetical protein
MCPHTTAAIAAHVMMILATLTILTEASKELIGDIEGTIVQDQEMIPLMPFLMRAGKFKMKTMMLGTQTTTGGVTHLNSPLVNNANQDRGTGEVEDKDRAQDTKQKEKQ